MTNLVRSLFRSVRIPETESPYDTLQLRVLYPALAAESQDEKNFGVLRADPLLAPFPVVVFMNGINVGPEVYQWLGLELAQRGFLFVNYSWVSCAIPGAEPGLTPGVDLARVSPQTYGSGPTASALPAILKELSTLNAGGPLHGLIDEQRVILGGHSGGGTIALQNANPRFFPSVVAAFAYAAHSLAPMMLGFKAGEVLPLPSDVPILLMGGAKDGVMAGSAFRYGGGVTGPGQIERTFRQAFSSSRGDVFVALIEGANHFSFCHPNDSSVGRIFLDDPPTRADAEVRALLTPLIADFLDAYVRRDALAQGRLRELAAQPPPIFTLFDRR